MSSSTAESKSPLRGGCLCGAVTWIAPLPPQNLSEDYDFTANNVTPPSMQKFPKMAVSPIINKWKASHCHCTSCRRSVGASYVDWFTVPVNELIISRNDSTSVYQSSQHCSREFCKKCGSSLFFIDDTDPEHLDISVGSVSTPRPYDYIEFTAHIWVEDVQDQVLDSQGHGGGIAMLMNDGLEKWKRGRKSEPFN